MGVVTIVVVVEIEEVASPLFQVKIKLGLSTH